MNFSDHFDHFVFVGSKVFDQFYSNALASYAALRFDDATIGALSKFLLNEVAGKDGGPFFD